MDMSLDLATAADPLDRALIRAVEQGLPLVPRPYAAIADEMEIAETEVIVRLARLIHAGTVKRFGIVVRHRELGYRANAMVVWAMPEGRVDELGDCIGRLPFVTLSYRRPARPPEWPYNLFTMIHGRDRAAVLEQVAAIVRRRGLEDIDHAVLFSGRCFKQRGARYGGPMQDPPTPPRGRRTAARGDGISAAPVGPRSPETCTGGSLS
jgi:DNA-binding Lrp family transcriptional regulator